MPPLSHAITPAQLRWSDTDVFTVALALIKNTCFKLEFWPSTENRAKDSKQGRKGRLSTLRNPNLFFQPNITD